MDYWDNWTVDTEGGCDCRCLLVKLSSEVSDMSESMRLALRDSTSQIVVRLAGSIGQAVSDGSLRAIADAPHTALTLYHLRLGLRC